MKKISVTLPQWDSRTKYKLKNRSKTAALVLFRYAMLLSVGYIVIYPLLYMFVTSLRSAQSYNDPSVIWILKSYDWFNWKDSFEAMDYLTCLKNTVLIEMVSAALEIASCSVIAYSFARFEYKLKKVLLVVMVLTIVIPSQMIVIPTMVNFSRLDFAGILQLIGSAVGKELRPNILDTPLTFYFPSLFGVGLRSGIMIFIFMQFFKGLPKELEEAAWIDGAGPVKTFLRIAVPSSGVVFLTVSIFSIVWHWNDYYLSAMYMSDNRTLALSLANLPPLLGTLGYGSNLVNAIGGSIMMGACLLFIAPMLIMYLLVQGKFVQSIDRVGITG